MNAGRSSLISPHSLNSTSKQPGMKVISFLQRLIFSFCLYFTIAVLFTFYIKNDELDKAFFKLHIIIGAFAAIFYALVFPSLMKFGAKK
jgi:hypothetical protein